MTQAPAPAHRGERAVQRLVEFAPATGGLALWVHHHDRPADEPAAGAPGTPPLATDGHTVHYAATFEALPLPEQTALVAKAVLHVALRHPQRLGELQRRLGDVECGLFMRCADALLNSALAHLSWLKLPAGSPLLEQLVASALNLTQSAEQALLAWDVESLYRAIDDRAPPERADAAPAQRRDGPRAAAARALGSGTPVALLPAAGAPQAPEAEAEAAREWRERLLRGHAADGAFSMLRTLLADLPTSRTPWEQVLRSVLARGLAPRPAPSWSRPARSYLANQGRVAHERRRQRDHDAGGGVMTGPAAQPGVEATAARPAAARRMPWEPGISGVRRVPLLALMVDVSGSIDEALLQRFARELRAIVRRQGAALALVVGDDRVRHEALIGAGDRGRGARIDPFDLSALAVQGGGGTDFTPLLEAADSHRPDIGVMLTDLDGPARFRPRWPVWWAVPEACAAAPLPFGRRLLLR